MNINSELESFFSDITSVIEDDFKFKRRLKIGDDAFKYLTDAKNTVECVESVGMGIGVGGLAYCGWAASLGVLGKAGLLVGLSTTPIGWIVGAGIAGTAGVYGLKRFKNKIVGTIEKKTLEKVPKFLNTPLDVLGLTVAGILIPPALKIAMADGNISNQERESLINYFVGNWGYNKGLIEKIVEEQEPVMECFSISQYVSEFKSTTEKHKEIKGQNIFSEVIEVMKEVMMADGIADPREQYELDVFTAMLSK